MQPLIRQLTSFVGGKLSVERQEKVKQLVGGKRNDGKRSDSLSDSSREFSE